MYYLQDLTMNAIAQEARTSRSTVSRLLSMARETGLVQIQVNNPSDRAPALGDRSAVVSAWRRTSSRWPTV